MGHTKTVRGVADFAAKYPDGYSVQMRKYMLEKVHERRVADPDRCWRPTVDALTVCTLSLGHRGPCGWERDGE